MDSSDSINSNGSSSSDIADNSSMITPSKRDIFLSTYRRQNFSLPDSLMHYIAKNPKNSNVYQKMIKRCKYFFIKNPILILSKLRYDQNEWQTCVNETWKFIDINTISCKLWIIDRLVVAPDDDSNNYLASLIVPKIYQCDVKHLCLCDQIISFTELNFLCSSVEDLIFTRVTVKNDDDTEVLFEKLVEQFSNFKVIDYTFTTPSNNISKHTFKKLWKIPNLSNYDFFDLINIPENFDIDIFYSFMKKNKKIRIYLEISEEDEARLEAIVDEILGTKNHEYKPPIIDFPGLVYDKYNKLYHLHLQ